MYSLSDNVMRDLTVEIRNLIHSYINYVHPITESYPKF